MRNHQLNVRSSQAGLTLIELLVGLVIGLLLALVASATYLYSKQAYNAVSENSQMDENGRLALNLLTRNIQSAGYVSVNVANGAPVPTGKKILGCDFGMTNPKGASSTSDLETCLTSLPAGTTQSGSIAMFYQTDAFNTGANFQGVDCIGNSSVQIANTSGGVVTNTFEINAFFFVSTTTVGTPFGTTTMGQLSCVTDPSKSTVPRAFVPSQPLIAGIHQIRARYLLPTENTSTAPGGNIYDANGLTPAQFEAVVKVELCVLTKAIQSSGNDTGASVTDCYGNTFIPPPSQSYRRFTSSVNLRNRTEAPT